MFSLFMSSVPVSHNFWNYTNNYMEMLFSFFSCHHELSPMIAFLCVDMMLAWWVDAFRSGSLLRTDEAEMMKHTCNVLPGCSLCVSGESCSPPRCQRGSIVQLSSGRTPYENWPVDSSPDQTPDAFIGLGVALCDILPSASGAVAGIRGHRSLALSV